MAGNGYVARGLEFKEVIKELIETAAFGLFVDLFAEIANGGGPART